MVILLKSDILIWHECKHFLIILDYKISEKLKATVRVILPSRNVLDITYQASTGHYTKTSRYYHIIIIVLQNCQLMPPELIKNIYLMDNVTKELIMNVPKFRVFLIL